MVPVCPEFLGSAPETMSCPPGTLMLAAQDQIHAPMGMSGQRSVLGFNLNKLMNGLADRRDIVLLG